MKKKTSIKTLAARVAMTLLMVLLTMTAQTARATDYITDVMLIGSTKASEITSLRTDYESQGWIFLEKDLNDGCGSGSDYIHLLYKTGTDASQAITAFYLQTGNTHPASQTIGGRTYHLTTRGGNSSFNSGNGDLNHNAGGDYIFLYYTKDAFSPARAVTSISFNSTSAGALNGVNLNKGCGANTDDIYMHVVSNATANPIEVSTQAKLEEAATLNEAYIKLTSNIALSSAFELRYGVSVTLDLNSHDLSRSLTDAIANGHVVKVNSGCTLTVTDGTSSSGIIKGGNTTTNGGGIVNEGTFVLNGGSVGNNHAANGGGIYNSGTLILNGGSVGGNGSTNGGGIYNSGTATLNGGLVAGNFATMGAGLYLNSGTITLCGGSIERNYASTNGGGVYPAGGALQMQGAPVVSQNTGNYNPSAGITDNVYLPSGKKITVSGALATGASIGITPASPTDVLTTDFSTHNPDADPNDFFFADDTAYRFALLEGNLYRYELVTSMDSFYTLENGMVVNQPGCRKVSALTDEPGVAMANGWYVVDQTCTFNNRITIVGTVHLILADYTELHANKGVRVPYGVNFHVWGQLEEDGSTMGALIADARNEPRCAGIGSNGSSSSGNLYFHGGSSGGFGGEDAAGIGGGAYSTMAGNITISGGSVTGSGGTNESKDSYGYVSGGAGIGCGTVGFVRGDIIITGGSVIGFGGAGGAGIGSGYDGWSYRRQGAYSEVPVESSSIYISGGNVFAWSVGGGAGIGGGIGEHAFHGCLGNLYITGGRVSAFGTFEDTDGSRSAEAIGHGRLLHDESYMGEFTVYDNAKVEASTSTDELHPNFITIAANNRTKVSDPNNKPTYKQLEIGPCDHSGATYTDNGNGTHTVSGCSWCLGETVGHTFTGGTCVCGAAASAETWTVTVNTYDAGTGAYVSTHYDVEKGSAYTLPPCDDLSGYEFAGWVADPASQANGCQPNDGETLLAAGHELTVTADVTLYARYRAIALSLADDGNNSTVLARYLGKKAGTVTLQGRTLYKDGSWNTLCLPFNVDNFTGTPLQGATVKTLASTGFSGGTLTMNFTEDVTSIKAGTPYIVKWDAGTDIVNPVFNGVIISDVTANVETEYVDFIGTYGPVSIYTAEKTNLYLGADNKLYYPTDEDFKVNACRGYFQLKQGLTAGNQSASVRAFVLNFGDDETTGIISVYDSGFTVNGSDAWYSLDGRRLYGKPTQRGIYINNGRKVVIK